MSDLVKRTYRIHKDHDKKVKKLAGKAKSESQIIREAIEGHTPKKAPKKA
jgi:hypothetical protein